MVVGLVSYRVSLGVRRKGKKKGTVKRVGIRVFIPVF